MSRETKALPPLYRWREVGGWGEAASIIASEKRIARAAAEARRKKMHKKSKKSEEHAAGIARGMDKPDRGGMKRGKRGRRKRMGRY